MWPSIGFSEHDSIWKSAAWLCWAQALFQLFPLPRSFGRQMLIAFAAMGIGRLELSRQVSIVRRSLETLALMTLVATIIWSMKFQPTMELRGLLLVALAWLLFVSSRGSDVIEILSGFQVQPALGPDLSVAHTKAAGGISQSYSNVVDFFRQRRRTRSLRQALQREHEEAVDSERLDGILARLHHEGMDALSPDDRRVLERVSESLRRQRHESNANGETTDRHI
jgi:hypothetical protein